MTYERIEMNPGVIRVPVELVLRELGAGISSEAILVDHPRLTLKDIHAAQAFAADCLAGAGL